MALRDKGPALAVSEQAMTVVPLEKDAVDGSTPIEVLARLPAQSRRDSKILRDSQSESKKKQDVESRNCIAVSSCFPAFLRDG
jgi:hypothetical protein